MFLQCILLNIIIIINSNNYYSKVRNKTTPFILLLKYFNRLYIYYFIFNIPAYLYLIGNFITNC